MRTLLAVAACVCAAAIFTGTAAADTPVTVSIIGCTLVHGGNVTVPAGSTISFRFGWFARSAGLDDSFLRALDLSASVDGNPVADPASYWSSPTATTNNGNDGYLTTWLYPTGITLQSGQSLTLVWNGVLAHPVNDGFKKEGGGITQAGDLLGGNDTCTVTAS